MTYPEHRELAGRYRLVEPLGQGGMATVWRAEHIELGSKVAIKLIDEGIAESPEALSRFRREAKAAAALNSAHVVQIFDYGIDEGTPYIAMELLEGESLRERLERTGALSVTETLRVVTHAARALEKAHEVGIVHRDIKPDNIFLQQGEDGELHAKLLDFGVAKAKKAIFAGAASSHTRTGALVGSPYYMSPELVRHNKEVDHHADLWALGVVTYECLLGSRPFESDTLGDLLILICTEDLPIPSEEGVVPKGFDAWFAKACARNPEDRFGSAKEMAEALEAAVSAHSVDAQPVATMAGRTTSGLARTDDGLEPSGAKSTKLVVAVAAVFAVATVAVAIGFLSGQAVHGNNAAAIGSGQSIGVAVSTASLRAPAEAVRIGAPNNLVEPVEEDGSAPDASAAKAKPTPPTTQTKSPPVTATKTVAPKSSGIDYGF